MSGVQDQVKLEFVPSVNLVIGTRGRMKKFLVNSRFAWIPLLAILAGIAISSCAHTPNDCLPRARQYQAILPVTDWTRILCIDYTKEGYPYRHYILAFEFLGRVYLQDKEGSNATSFSRAEATPMNLANSFYSIRRWPKEVKITKAFFVE
jgi:hypothetical protein